MGGPKRRGDSGGGLVRRGDSGGGLVLAGDTVGAGGGSADSSWVAALTPEFLPASRVYLHSRCRWRQQ
jgi:hypothetical protein